MTGYETDKRARHERLMELELIQDAFHTGKQRDNRNKQNSDCRHVSDPPLLCLSGQFGLSFLQHGVEILGGIRRNLTDLELDALGLEGSRVLTSSSPIATALVTTTLPLE